MVVDPWNWVGKAASVPYDCMAAAAYGADGLIIEAHVNPKTGIGDDPKQAITPDVLARVIRDCKSIHAIHQQHHRAHAAAIAS